MESFMLLFWLFCLAFGFALFCAVFRLIWHLGSYFEVKSRAAENEVRKN